MAETYKAISTQTLTSDVSSVTFSSIPQTFTDLVLVISATTSVTDRTIRFRCNGDTTTNYSSQNMLAYSVGAIAQNVSNSTSGYLSSSSDISTPQVYISHWNNYSNATTEKQILWTNCGMGEQIASAGVSLWKISPVAITTILLFPNTGDFETDSIFTLFGIEKH